MAKNLVIVESPAKAKTIKKFLGKDYEVIASYGHVRDLPKSTMGVDPEDDFEPHYITIRGKGEVLALLRKEVKKASKIYLATDPDREGEAISYHLAIALKLEEGSFQRITFNEITKNAVKDSIKNARKIDMSLVDAQQARRVLDRLVGYEISPLLWQKIKRGLSAGRVQSVALKMICDREKEIDAFIPEEYWSLDSKLICPGNRSSIAFHYSGDIANSDEAEKIIKEAKADKFVVKEVKEGTRTRKAPLPFTTSTLQQDAASRLNFSTSKTMRLAQELYEGIDIKGRGTIGLITYLRTDSVRISEEADAAARSFIVDKYGNDYVAEVIADGNKGKKIQDAHEAIRPTYVDVTPESIKESVSRDLFRLYQLIYNRFLASRMKPAVYKTGAIKVNAGGHTFKASTSSLDFAGFMEVYSQNSEEKEENIKKLEEIQVGTELKLDDFESKQHFTNPPVHFTEALLVRTMEENGIGRPSTYAPTIATILNRRYVIKEEKNLYVTELGEAVNGIMETAFPVIIDTEFTANMESLLDKIGEGVIDWKVVVRNFYPDLDIAVKNAEKALENIHIADEVSDTVCEECGKMMVIKYGPHGKFLACPGFPDCRNTKPYFEKIGVQCPKCGKDIVIKKTKKGRRYFGCIDYPECDFMSWNKPSSQKCPECGSLMVEKGNKLCCSNEECGYVMSKKKENE
ncbi:DNA topoisomerase I [Eubacterium ruminantium]|uniref:DNA topoisomerase 1 n=1 Tax=Eubacterium ruminantium TaxID=42322 RepID=A0A1T4MFV4_9FIRM|nr:type I DNA topoisomerase [Eubacterium ruminantium]SCW47732.1 DNA topoisomerase I [Eubacterium ruminantium]SDM55844.1 DNA topoisomerase I [Eubacterium ruminantium]SJZ65737.1 DNA topoisomerase I [Eubacterium ruminantium]